MTAFACPHCDNLVAIPDRVTIGQRFRCPHCGQRIVLEQRTGKKNPQAGPRTATPQETAPLPPDWIALDPPAEGPQTPTPAARDRTAPQPLDSLFEMELAGGNTDPAAIAGESFENLSPVGAGGAAHGITPPGVVARKGRRRGRRWLIPVSLLSGAALVAIIFLWDHFANRRARVTLSKPAPAADNQASNRSHSGLRQEAGSTAVKVNSQPIRMLLAPAGVRIVVHLRPAELWSTAAETKPGQPSRSEELRRCLAPLSAWTERQIADRCLFPAGQIDEVLFSLVLRSPGDPPDVAATVWLKEASTPPQIAKKFGGQKLERTKLPTWVKGEQSLVIRDGKTFAVGPQAAAREMADAAEQPNPTDESIEELLKETDRSRQITLVFRPDDLDRFRESLFAPAMQEMVHRVAQWLDPDAAEGAVLSFHLADPFRIRLDLRNRLTTTAHGLEEELQQRLDALPKELLANVERLDPRTSGRRKLVGRVPAMWKAVALGVQASAQARLATLESVLPERAAPNLSLATYLALSEPLSASSGSKNGRGRAGMAGQQQTVLQRLQAKVDVDFRRTPLSDAFSSIGEDIGLTFEIDGGALKIAGYTKNMPQTIKLTGVPATEALRTILKPYPKMALVLDEPHHAVIVTTTEWATAKGKQPLGLQK